MVLGDGHEYERTTSLRLVSRGGGSEFGVPSILGLHGLCAWQSRRSKSHFSAGPSEVGNGNLGRAPAVLTQFAGAASVIVFEEFEWFATFGW